MMKNLFSCLSRQDSRVDEEGRQRKKMIIVGDGECGKTCLVTRMTTGAFVGQYVPTVFETDVVTVNTGKEEVQLVIYDTAGQEDYDRVRSLLYDDVDVVLMCFSVAEADSLSNVIEKWTPEIRFYCGNVPIILVGNKKDLRDNPGLASKCSSKDSLLSDAGEGKQQNSNKLVNEENQSYLGSNSPYANRKRRVRHPVKHSEGVTVARKIGAVAYFEASALSGENVEELTLATTKASVLGTKKSKKFQPLMQTLEGWTLGKEESKFTQMKYDEKIEYSKLADTPS